jgi:hypothetical protein
MVLAEAAAVAGELKVAAVVNAKATAFEQRWPSRKVARAWHLDRIL